MKQQRQYMLGVVQQLEERAAKDKKSDIEAKAQLAAVREAMADAEVAALSAATRADASQWALSQAHEVLRRLPGDQACSGDGQRSQNSPEKDQEAPVTVVKAILDFLGECREATTGEIVKAVRQVRPKADSSRVNPELTRLCRRGDITRIRTGLYQLAGDGERSLFT